MRSIHANGNTVTTAIAMSTAYQPAVDAARRQRVRGPALPGRATGVSIARVSGRAAHSSACPRSRKRTLTIENTSVIASSAIAIAEAYPAWPSTNACFHR